MKVLNGAAGAAWLAGPPSAEQLLPGHPSSLAVWGEADSSTLICRQVQDITHDVKTFLFESAQPSLFQHEPGQFVTLQLQIDGRSVSRCYTISTPPTRPHLLGITVKRQPGGLVSNWLHDTMAPGQRISADGPFGVFTIARHPSAKYLFLSGGKRDHSRHVHDAEPVRPRFRCRRRVRAQCADTIRHHLPPRARDDRQYGAHRPRGPRVRAGFGPGAVGRISRLPERRDAATAGTRPGGACRVLLRARAVHGRRSPDAGHCRFRHAELSRGVLLLRGPPDEGVFRSRDNRCSHRTTTGQSDASEAKTYSVEFVRSGRTFTCADDENVLDAAYAAGLSPLSSCGQGMCGTCKTTVLSGTVDMQHNGGIRPREVAQNKILICCSKPLSDLTIDA